MTLSPDDYIARCRRFAREVILPHRDRHDADRSFPTAVHEAAHAAGLIHVGFPPEHGGAGLSHRTMVLGGLEMARVCAPITFTLAFNHGALRPAMIAGTDAQRQRLVTDLLAAGGYASWCMTEPDVAGSNLLAIRTRAVRVPGGWELTGHKCMVGMGTQASVFFVLADAVDSGQRLGPTLFAVPRGPGVTVGENTHKLGFRCLPTPDVIFDGAPLTDDAIIGQPGGGVPVLLDSLDYMRLGGGVVTLGLALGALDDVRPWLADREVYGGARLGDESYVQVTVGRLLARVDAVRGLLLQVADALDAGRPCAREASALKLLAADLALDATSQATQLHGWRGIDGRYPAEKRLRDARQTSIYEGTSEIQAMNLFRTWASAAPLDLEPTP